MPPNEIVKPVNAEELAKALKQRGWKMLESREVVNRDGVRDLNSRVGSLVNRDKKLCVVVIERD